MKPRLFHYRILARDGVYRQGTVLGLNRRQLWHQFQQSGAIPLAINAAWPPRRYHWQADACCDFITQLADLLDTGLALAAVLALMADSHPYPEWQALIHQLHQAITEGLSFSQALRAHHHVFPALYGRSLAAAEQSGELAAVCRQLAQHQRQALALRQRLLRALRYPLFLLTVALLITLAMLVTLLPQFAQLYASLNAPLPWLTQRLLALGAGLQSHWLGLLGSAGALALLSAGMARHYAATLRRLLQRLALRLPGYGPLLRDTTLAQLFHTLALLLHAGIALPQALTACRHALRLEVYRRALHHAVLHLRQGELLSATLAERRLFPAQCHQLIRQGEASGRLALLCTHLGEYYRQQAQRRGETLTTLVEPAMLLLCAALIALLVLALYLPILHLGDVMQ
ncbi:type II secretion system F family protein [Edwardsiella hoshinae]|uniref:Type IV pilin biogenesis protein n=1 Tax=Edwardsiella hoshinae TaxID=93378 RepID=A0A376DKA5_9GAMM|nr:type II secretion system F family protein [Edwardsiella hoshinae]QPR29298.1 type II secretion system F family protein [Edwardsiella hoshinae]STC90829.1 type IV pilin biogenesis protein [Edwardsiella hoshinae]